MDRPEDYRRRSTEDTGAVIALMAIALHGHHAWEFMRRTIPDEWSGSMMALGGKNAKGSHQNVLCR